MFLKALLAILVLMYALWGIIEGRYVFPSRSFNSPIIIDDITSVYYVFFSLLSLVVSMILFTVKNVVTNGKAKFYDIAGTIFLVMSIILFVLFA